MTNRNPGVQPGPRALLEQGVAAQRAGRPREAAQLYRAALKLAPGFAEAHQYLATALSVSGEHDAAERSIRRALDLDPGRAVFHATRGAVLLAAGRVAPAREALRVAVASDPKAAAVRFQLAFAHERAGDFAAAEGEYRAYLALDARNARGWSNLGVVQIALARPDDAVESLGRAVALEPALVAAWVNLARAQRDAGRHEHALESLARAARLAPNEPMVHSNLGQVLRELGRIDDAIAAFRRAIAIAPGLAIPRVMLAMTRTHAERDAEVEWIERAAREPKAAGIREHDALFAHAKVLDDLGDRDAAFDELVRANASRRATIRYSIADDVARFARIREVFDADRVAALAGDGCPDSAPVFVVGMPRSGTTLAEQVLASHPAVFGAGETEHLRRALCSEDLSGGHPDGFASPAEGGLAAAGRRYVATACATRATPASRSSSRTSRLTCPSRSTCARSAATGGSTTN
ncbi:MAG: tetratricopeptide repeat protein [Planctomycetes bacterium]|nr:tetratricopeptide repeat protein [Planctomycetota bacterium]